MKKHVSVGLLCILLLSSCSTYKTSSNDISFTGTKFHEQPVLPLENQGLDNQDIRFLGWIEAYVLSPSVFKSAPTQQQVNYVLAHQAKQQGADAVLHVSYKESFSATGKSRITAKGQAIQIKSASEKAWVQEEPALVEQQNDAVLVMSELDEQVEPEAVIKNESEVFAEQELAVINVISPSQLMVKQQAVKPIPTDTTVSALVIKEEKAEAKNTSGVQLISHLNQFYDDEMNRMQLMHNNAQNLKQHAQKYNDKAMLNAAERLLEQLELQMQAFRHFAP